MPSQFEVEPNPAALERRLTLSAVVPPGQTGNEFAVEPGKPGNVLLVTGGNKVRPYMGIGTAVGILAAQRGMDYIVFTSTSKPESEKQAREAAQLMSNQGARVVWLGVDHTRRTDNIEVVEIAFDRFGKVNYFFGNAGDVTIRPVLRIDNERLGYDPIQRDIELMLLANYQISKAILDNARRTKTLAEFRAAVYSGSVMDKMTAGRQTGYTMAKIAVIGLAADLGAEFGNYTRFNVARFGFIRTGMTREMHESVEGQAFAKQRMALGRIGEPEEAAKAVVFLLGPDASYITRSVLTIDGGILPLAR